MKDYTFSISANNGIGRVIFNESDRARGYKKSWFKTVQSLRKHLESYIDLCNKFGYTEIEWKIYHRNGTIIETSREVII